MLFVDIISGFQLRFASVEREPPFGRHRSRYSCTRVGELNRFNFNQGRLKRLNTQTVKCWCTVE